MGRLFGTDGVRGIANGDLDCNLTFSIGQCGAKVLTSEVHRPRIVIGRDTRNSGKMLMCALAAGICSVGGEAIDCGVVPTPGVAYLTRAYEADAGVVISASHNSYEYNGIKWFDASGFKLPDAVEDEIEALVRSENGAGILPTGKDVGTLVYASGPDEEYIEFLTDACDVSLEGLNIVVDCANGAASGFAEKVFTRLGAKVAPYYNMPDGMNINAQCGSTHPEKLQRRVVELGADAGFAFDGDADRLIACDEHGVLVDGDKIMAICALDMKERGTLVKNTLVTTVMSNLGMKTTLRENGVDIIETAVGDRYVLECMQRDGYIIGGEQSGHVIFLDSNTTGDGMLTAIKLLSVMVRKKQRLSQMSRKIQIYPQVLVNVEVPNEMKQRYAEFDEIMARISEAEQKFSGKGRVLVRTSGTEPLVRVMIEGENDKLIDSEAIAISKLVAQKLGGRIRD